MAPSVSVLESGERNRYGFGLYDASQAQITDAEAALYFEPIKGGEVEGPFPARYESLAVSPQFQSEGTAADPDSATGVYVAEVPFRKPGRYQALGVAATGEGLVAATPAGPPTAVTKDNPVPDVGEPAPDISTPTVASVGGAIEEIDTRVPTAPELHDTDFADVVGDKPTALLFATPALCLSRVCGPVVDVALEVRAERDADDVEFIHQEIYENNELEAASASRSARSTCRPSRGSSPSTAMAGSPLESKAHSAPASSNERSKQPLAASPRRPLTGLPSATRGR